jgi:integrase
MRRSNKLTALAVSRQSTPGRYADGGGLYLQVAAGGTKAWLFRYMRDGEARAMGLGPIDIVPLADAREKARECRRQLLDGADPIAARRDERQRKRAEAARGITFEECAEKYIAANKSGWRNAKHAEQWKSTLETYAYPVFGKLDVAAVDTVLVLKAIEPIWSTKTETAGRVRGRIESVLDWAKARKHRQGENPAQWKGHLDKLLPARSKVARVKHHPALPFAEISAFMADLRGRDGISPRALEFTILTAVRTNETIGARWSEIDLRARTWTVPAERMKGEREHKVPLSARAVAILADLPREAHGSDFVFIGDVAGAHLSNMAMLTLLQNRMGHPDITVHGFRSTFRDWAAERTNYPNHVVEMALGHAIEDEVEAAYRRGDLFEKRRRLMNAWAEFCATTPARGAVVPLNAHHG